MKKTFLIFSLFLIFTSFKPESEIKPFGFYSNEKSSDGEHSNGYTLQLWKYKNNLIGKLSYNEGQIGTQVSGFISNVKYNSEKETLIFESKLDEERIVFNGKISKNKVVGTYIWPTRLDKNQTLKMCCKDAQINTEYQTFDEWEKMWKQYEN